MKKVVAILPAYNEEVSIGSVVLNTKNYVNHVIVIDDGSVDRTAQIAKMAGAKVIKHQLNKGKGAALKTGFRAINEFDVIVTMDSDGQHNPDEIPNLLAPILKGEADMVNGSRYLNGYDNDTPAYRRIGQTVLDKATNLISDLKITDSQSGFRAFTRNTIPLFRFNNADFSIESEMLIDAANAGLNIKEVEIGVRYDVDGSTKNPLSHGLGVLIRIINDLEFQRPLIYFTIPGTIIIAAGITLGLIFFGDYINNMSTSLFPTFFAILLTLGGIFLAFTGIIINSISKMINRNAKRPKYNIELENDYEWVKAK